KPHSHSAKSPRSPSAGWMSSPQADPNSGQAWHRSAAWSADKPPAETPAYTSAAQLRGPPSDRARRNKPAATGSPIPTRRSPTNPYSENPAECDPSLTDTAPPYARPYRHGNRATSPVRPQSTT